MKKKLVLALIASVVMAQSGITYTAHAMQEYPYYDMTDDNAAYIETVLNAGIMSAKNSEDFGTEDKMTRFDVLDALYRLEGTPAIIKDVTFEDAKGHKEVAFAEKAELFNGLPETFFADQKISGDTELTKEEFAVILYNFANYDKILKMDTNAVRLINYLSVFADSGEVDEWAKTAVKWNLGYEFLKSVDNSEYLKINETITKGEVAEALAKYMGEVEKVKESSRTTGSNSFQTSATTQNTSKESGTESIVQNKENKHNSVAETTPEDESKEESAGTSENQPTIPEQGEDAGETTHTHHWLPIYEMILVDRQEGYFQHKEVSPEEGHYEKVEVSPEEGHYEKVEISPEEGHYEKVEVSPEEGHYENKLVEEAWTETIEHPAETEKKWVVDQEAWTETVNHPEKGHYETVVVKPAWTETINHPEKGHYEETPIYEMQIRHICTYCNQDCTGNETAHAKQHALAGEPNGWYDKQVQVQVGTEEKWVVDQEAWTETIKHPAETEEKWVVDQEAWTETVNHPEKGHYETVVVKPGWTEEIKHPARYEKVWIVDKEAVYENQWIVDKEAVYENQWIVDKEAVYENQWIVDKEAVYDTVWVDPVEEHEENTLVGFECSECGEEVGGPRFVI